MPWTLLAILCNFAGLFLYWRLYNRERDRALAEGRHTVRSWPGKDMRGVVLSSPLILTLSGLAGLFLLLGGLALLQS